MMPKKSGVEVVRELRVREYHTCSNVDGKSQLEDKVTG